MSDILADKNALKKKILLTEVIRDSKRLKRIEITENKLIVFMSILKKETE